jgi:hypothetical protein
MMDNNLEQSSMNFATVILGLVAVFVVVIVITAMSNAKITLDVKARKINGRSPLFVIFEKDRAMVLCTAPYSLSDEAKGSLQNICGFLDSMNLSSASPEESLNALNALLSSPTFDKNQFYIFGLIKPSGVRAFYKLESVLTAEDLNGRFAPIPENWNFRIGLER